MLSLALRETYSNFFYQQAGYLNWQSFYLVSTLLRCNDKIEF